MESAHRQDSRAPFFRTYGLSCRITRSEIRNRSFRNVFVMPADAYLSYIRFHHEKSHALRGLRNKAPAESGSATERRESEEKENMEARGITEDEQAGEERRSKAGKRTKPGTLNLEGLSRTT